MFFSKTQNDKDQENKHIKGHYFIKGIIHVNHQNDFEVLEQSFFYSGLESNGRFQSQADIDVYLENELKDLDWNINPEVGRCYGVLYEFKCNYTTDYWGEHDMEIDPINLHFNKFDDDTNEAILNCDYFQLEE